MEMENTISELVIRLTRQTVTALVQDLFDDKSSAENNVSKLLAISARTSKKRILPDPIQPSGAKLRMTVPRSVATAGAPVTNLVFQSEINVLEEMGEDILAAFESGSGEGLEKLPSGRLRDRMECLIGTVGRRSINISHLRQADLIYEIIRRKDTGAGRQDALLFEGFDQSTLLLKCDFDAKKTYTGTQDPAIAAMVRDLYDINHGFCIIGPKYRWPTQLFCDIPNAALAEKFYNQPLDGLADDGTKVGDVFRVGKICDSRNRGEFTFIEEKPLAIVSGYNKPLRDECVLAGDSKDILVRSGMGVSFTFEKCEPQLQDAVTCGGNPSLKTCHGFVAGIHDGPYGKVELSILLALHKGNLPPFLKWNRLPQDAVLQTNLTAIIPASCVVSTFHILPITLHPLPAFLPKEVFRLGNQACPIQREVFVAGQLDIFPGEIRPAQNGAPPGELWSKRCENDKLKSFTILSDFCLRGGDITDKNFEHHCNWKKRILVAMQSVPHFQPRAELHRVCTFPPDMALPTIWASQSLIGNPCYTPPLRDLHSAVIRFAASKAKKAKNGTGAVCIVPLNIPGRMLLQLVHKYGKVSTVRFKEGAIEAVFQQFHQAEELLGSNDGVFDCGGSGIIQLFAPITARWVLYNPKVFADDTASVGSYGRAELEFKGFMGMDRHGGKLAGEGEGEGGVGEGSGGAPTGDCHSNSTQRITENGFRQTDILTRVQETRKRLRMVSPQEAAQS